MQGPTRIATMAIDCSLDHSCAIDVSRGDAPSASRTSPSWKTFHHLKPHGIESPQWHPASTAISCPCPPRADSSARFIRSSSCSRPTNFRKPAPRCEFEMTVRRSRPDHQGEPLARRRYGEWFGFPDCVRAQDQQSDRVEPAAIPDVPA